MIYLKLTDIINAVDIVQVLVKLYHLDKIEGNCFIALNPKNFIAIENELQSNSQGFKVMQLNYLFGQATVGVNTEVALNHIAISKDTKPEAMQILDAINILEDASK